MKISENTSVSMPVKNMLMIIAGVVSGVFAYTEITARLTSLETSRELFQADLLKKSEQLPTDQEQFMLVEDLYKSTEKLEIRIDNMMHNKINIEFLKKQTEKLLEDVERLKDKYKKITEMNLFRSLKKEVETGANGTQDYIIKKGINKGKKVST